MTNFLDTREPGDMFTNQEFYSIPRNSDGDIIDLYDAYSFITDKQREMLTEDDWSRCIDYDEELCYMMDEF